MKNLIKVFCLFFFFPNCYQKHDLSSDMGVILGGEGKQHPTALLGQIWVPPALGGSGPVLLRVLGWGGALPAAPTARGAPGGLG